MISETNSPLRLSINVAIYNEEENIATLLESLAGQTHLPDEIIFVDDGSTDATAKIIGEYANKNPRIKYIYQKNSGPAAARNNAWQHANADICLFTDGDCVPQKNWVEKMLRCFTDDTIGAVAGTYKTENNSSLLARFIGYEIAYKYRNVRGSVDFHGTYNLAIRRKVLTEIGGFNEKFITAEDADLTYRISDKYTIFFTPESIVGHYHPKKFWGYMGNQIKRGEDRVLLYKTHPARISHDTYTGKIIKYQVLAGGLITPSLFLFYPFFHGSFIIPIVLGAFILFASSYSFAFIARNDIRCAMYGVVVQFFRTIAWFIGLVRGVLRYSF